MDSEFIKYLTTLNEQAIESGESIASMALKWVLEQEGVTSVLVGARTLEQFADSLKCMF